MEGKIGPDIILMHGALRQRGRRVSPVVRREHLKAWNRNPHTHIAHS